MIKGNSSQNNCAFYHAAILDQSSQIFFTSCGVWFIIVKDFWSDRVANPLRAQLEVFFLTCQLEAC